MESKVKHPNDQPRANLIVCGLSHHSASLAERELFQLNRQEMPKALKTFRNLDGVTEVVLLSTCNRFEAYFCSTRQERGFQTLRRFYRRFRKIDIAPYEHLFYTKHASSVVRHLCRVAAAMDSLVVGETQIIGQVRESYSLACSLQTPGRILHKAFHAAFRAGKAVRSQTAIGQGQRSVAGEAVALLKERLSPDDAVVVVGVNENTRLAAKCLFDAGYRNLTFANRTMYKAQKLAAQFEAQAIGLERVAEALVNARALITCTGAPHAIFSAEQMEQWRRQQSGPLFVVDMAVPRDVELPETGLPELTVIDLQDLKLHLELQDRARQADFPRAERLIEQEVSAFQAWLETADDPVLGDMAERFEQIRQKNLSQYATKLSEEEWQLLEEFSRKLVRQMLAVPKRYLEQNGKNSVENE